ncbi:pyrimidine reductase family protein [Subtercola frigoramans]|uniref:Riboflavin biosynthesis pyrimidine reductase n=1 Tax=Subtercola frigoramans TaxID=120298 RepID=A0ABS2L6M0_9MICO|nr:pyrimidine reductase family protein [Subtercola frigoramans]MBM7472141.1 riboflavin biosynthesis pyrimidine reductase [Subtercola frigoramans]
MQTVSELDALTDAQLIALYAPADRSERLVRANFVSSIDGSATVEGLSGRLGGPADKRVFDVLRQLCDVVVVGAGTLRAEGYGAMRLEPGAALWRAQNGLPEHPAFAIVSRGLELDLESDVFTKAPRRPLILTIGSADAARRAALEHVADVVDCGQNSVEPKLLVAELLGRGLTQIHCEGGPSLLGDLVANDELDELCLTLSPVLEGGEGPRITRISRPPVPRALTLDHVLIAGSMMLTKYSRAR